MKLGGAIARVYAQALYESAHAKGAAQERLDEVRDLLDILNREKRFLDVLFSPQIKLTEKEKLVDDVFGGSISSELRNLIVLLLRFNRHFFLVAVLESYIEIFQESKGVVRAKVTTAVPLTANDRDRLVDALASRLGSDVQLDEEVDSKLMGGAILRYDDYVADGSLRYRLARMKQKLLASNE
ncbi:MAG: ATP synthase F1 subunit delta [Gemmatimonadetes bacterium]|nr:ATP synthase F1 subunit delta [Gemmatimonadota bacterium]